MRQSFDERVARWMRRSNPGYLGGRSESVGPPILPQAALETFKMPFSAGSTVESLIFYGDAQSFANSSGGEYVHFVRTVTPSASFADFDLCLDDTILTFTVEGLCLVTFVIAWGNDADGWRSVFPFQSPEPSELLAGWGELGPSAGTGTTTQQSGATLLWARVGDTLSLVVDQTSGASLSISGATMGVVMLSPGTPTVTDVDECPA